MRESQKKKLGYVLTAIGITAIFFIIMVVGMYFYYFEGSISKNHSYWGEFGDYVGGVLNPLLAFFALIALLYTIKLQSDELKLSREELQLSREELEKSAIALRQQSETLRIQNFESTLFNLIKNFRDVIDSINSDAGNTGKRALDDYHHVFRVSSPSLDRLNKITDENIRKNIYIKAYEKTYEKNKINLRYYFKNLYFLVNFIDKNSPEDSREKYFEIINSLMSPQEQILLFYHTLLPEQNKYKSLITKCHIFKDLNLDYIIDKENQVPLYDRDAWGDRQDIDEIYLPNE